MRLEHDIFNKPLAANVQTHEMDTPKYYLSADPDLPKKMRGWKVHDGEFGHGPDGCDVGMVSDPYGFEDSPDTEWISSGVNSKGPMSVALGRQGNVFHWGFYGGPDRLTQSAKAVFLNTLVYMTRFEGAPMLVQKTGRSREWCLKNVSFVRNHGASNPDIIPRLFPKSVLEEVGDDADDLEAYYHENLEYLRLGEDRQWHLDEDLKSLGVSNRKPEFLTSILARLVLDPGDDLALELAARYIGKDVGESAETLAEFIDDNGPYLFFSDVGGGRWFVDEPRKARERAAVGTAAGEESSQ